MTVLCFVSGLFLFTYPIVSNQIERNRQQKAIATYEKDVKEKIDMEAVWEMAQNYNEMLAQTHENIVAGIAKEVLCKEHYETLLNVSETGMMGTVSIPKINVELPIYHGTGKDVLAVGAGHLEGTALPVGGINTRCVLTGHRGLPSSKLFTRLDEMKEGDLFYLDVCGKTLAYEVSEIQVIEPDDIKVIEPRQGEDLVSLVTCTPYGLNTHRLVITGRSVPYQKKERVQFRKSVPSIREVCFMCIPIAFLIVVFIPKKKQEEKMLKTKKVLILFVSALFFISGSAEAAKGESPFVPKEAYKEEGEKYGKIHIGLIDGEEGIEFFYVKVADWKEGNYEMTGEFAMSKVNLNEIETAEQLEEVAVKLGKLCEKADGKIMTDQNGGAEIQNLSEGAYLFMVKERKDYDQISPFLVAIPTWNNQNGEMNYEIEVVPKHTPFPQKPKKEIVNTGDKIQVTGHGLGVWVTAVVVILCMWRMRKNQK